MKKLFKFIAGTAAIGAVAAGIYYFMKKQTSDDAEDFFSDDFEDEDFDLDDDLGPVDREYVSLNPEAKTPVDAEEKAEAPADAAEDAKPETPAETPETTSKATGDE